MSQFSLFGAAASPPSHDDLGGLLLAGGHWVRRAGTARLSVVVPDRWRAVALTAEFAGRDLAGPDAIVDAASGFGVRTIFASALVDHAARWVRGANHGPPADFTLTPGGLRLWALASGQDEPGGYLLGTSRPDDVIHTAAGAQLSRLGVAAVSVSARVRPGWRVTSTRRVRRLAELLGPAPDGGAGDWPALA